MKWNFNYIPRLPAVRTRFGTIKFFTLNWCLIVPIHDTCRDLTGFCSAISFVTLFNFTSIFLDNLNRTTAEQPTIASYSILWFDLYNNISSFKTFQAIIDYFNRIPNHTSSPSPLFLLIPRARALYSYFSIFCFQWNIYSIIITYCLTRNIFLFSYNKLHIDFKFHVK